MANKTFWKGEWHLVAQLDATDAKGRLGAPCPPFVEGEDVKWVAVGSYGASGKFVRASDPTHPPRPLPRPGSRAYKVITQADPWFAGRFDPARLEELLNELGGAGWRVVGVTGAGSPGASKADGDAPRPEMTILMERVVDEAQIAEERRLAEVRSPGAPA